MTAFLQYESRAANGLLSHPQQAREPTLRREGLEGFPIQMCRYQHGEPSGGRVFPQRAIANHLRDPVLKLSREYWAACHERLILGMNGAGGVSCEDIENGGGQFVRLIDAEAKAAGGRGDAVTVETMETKIDRHLAGKLLELHEDGEAIGVMHDFPGSRLAGFPGSSMWEVFATKLNALRALAAVSPATGAL